MHITHLENGSQVSHMKRLYIRNNMNSKREPETIDNILMPAPVNIKMRCDFWMSSTALSIVLCCGNLSRCRRLANIVRDVQELKISAYWCDNATRRKYVIVVGRRSWSSGHWEGREGKNARQQSVIRDSS